MRRALDPLPSSWSEGRADLVDALTAAYSKILDSRMPNFALWHGVRSDLQKALERRWEAAGFWAPVLYYDALLPRVALPGPSKDPNAHIMFVQALMTDYTPSLQRHIEQRMGADGNVHLEFTGPTGMGKSSCAVGLADAISPIAPRDLIRHLSRDQWELNDKIAAIERGGTVVQDEYLDQGGEGSATLAKAVRNLEDTLRQTGKNLFVCSPRDQELGTMQAVLELLLWSNDPGRGLFMCWTGEIPQGVVVLPWMRKELYDVYLPWKIENVKRQSEGRFRDTTQIARLAMQVFDEPRFVKYMITAVNKPKRADFKAGVELFQPRMTTVGQTDKLVTFMYEVAQNFGRLKDDFSDLFGVKPSKGLLEISEKCYEE